MPDTPDKLQIYPRGFLGKPLPATLAKKDLPFSAQLNQKQFTFSIFDTTDKKRLGDKEVEMLFQKYVRSEGNIDSAKFRESVFKCAFRLFGTKDFHFWYYAQKASPLYSDYHQRFLEDTLLYLSTGRREYSVETWSGLLTLDASLSEAGEFDPLVSEFFGERVSGYGEKTPKNRNVVEIIQKWWSYPAGVGDLLYTLHILFGDV